MTLITLWTAKTSLAYALNAGWRDSIAVNPGAISITGNTIFLIIFAAILYILYKYLIARRNRRIDAQSG